MNTVINKLENIHIDTVTKEEIQSIIESIKTLQTSIQTLQTDATYIREQLDKPPFTRSGYITSIFDGVLKTLIFELDKLTK